MAQEYELVTVAKGDLSETDRAELIDQIKKIVAAEKGEVTGFEDLGKRELAYDIRKNTHGFYALFNFKGDSKIPPAINSKLKISEELLRFLIVRKEDKKVKS